MALLFLLILHLQQRRRPRVVHLNIGKMFGQVHITRGAALANLSEWAASAGQL